MSDGKFRVLLIAVLVAILLGLGVIVFGFHSTQDASHAAYRASQEALKSLCLQKRADQRNIEQTKQFLRNGHHLGGVPDSLLLRGIRQQEADLATLRGVKCP